MNIKVIKRNNKTIKIIKMDLNKILQIEDISKEISGFLTFEDKVKLYKETKINLFTYYNFFDKEYNDKTMYSLFDCLNSDDYFEYFSELCSWEFQGKLDEEYDIYYGYTREDYMYDEYNNIAHDKIRFFTELFYSTYQPIYVRKMIEYIENNNSKLKLKYDDEFDIIKFQEDMNIDIFDEIIEYYKLEMIQDDFDEDLICYKCGKFGHENGDEECIFYNEDYENKVIRSQVQITLLKLTEKVEERIKKEEKIKNREKGSCVTCKVNNKKMKCVNNNCRTCCEKVDNICKVHKKIIIKLI